jgi:hypothetical protein
MHSPPPLLEPNSAGAAVDDARRCTPTFVYVGASKAGSTWIYNVLARHPEIFMAPGKGLYYFDGHFERGLSWYLSHFQDAEGRSAVGEVSHSYLYSRTACRRIWELNPQMRIVACIREPVERAFSAYLDGVKNGQFAMSFEDALREAPSLIDRGRYATHLQPYLEQFGRANVHVNVFDDLAADPQRFASELYDFLGVSPLMLSARDRQKMMPAARPRSPGIVRLAKRGSELSRKLGFRRLRGRIKTSRWIRNLLYAPYEESERPGMQESTRQSLRETFRDEVERLDGMLGLDLMHRWEYAEPAQPDSGRAEGGKKS